MTFEEYLAYQKEKYGNSVELCTRHWKWTMWSSGSWRRREKHVRCWDYRIPTWVYIENYKQKYANRKESN